MAWRMEMTQRLLLIKCLRIIYAYIEFAIINSKLNVQEYIIRRAAKRKSALLRNAKIRLSNIHPGRLLMNIRGVDKWIK